MKTLILTDNEVKGLLSMAEVMEAVESAFREKGLGRAQMPAKIYLFYKKYDGDLRTMPSYLESLNVSAVKIVNVHPQNRSRHNLPTVMAIIVLIDPETGAPTAIMGGTTVTDMRTGASGGIAAKYLARKDSKIAGFIGAGAQAITQLSALLQIYRDLEVRIWSRSEKTKQKFINEIAPVHGHLCKATLVGTVKEAVEGADIVVSTTPSRKPLIMNASVSPGTHFSCIGADAPGKQELDPAILKRAKIVVDDWEQASHSGEINIPLSQGIISKEDVWAEIGEIVAGLKPGRQTDGEITVFTSTGLAVQDGVTAKIAYDKALEIGTGKSVEIL